MTDPSPTPPSRQTGRLIMCGGGPPGRRWAQAAAHGLQAERGHSGKGEARGARGDEGVPIAGQRRGRGPGQGPPAPGALPRVSPDAQPARDSAASSPRPEPRAARGCRAHREAGTPPRGRRKLATAQGRWPQLPPQAGAGMMGAAGSARREPRALCTARMALGLKKAAGKTGAGQGLLLLPFLFAFPLSSSRLCESLPLSFILLSHSPPVRLADIPPTPSALTSVIKMSLAGLPTAGNLRGTPCAHVPTSLQSPVVWDPQHQGCREAH